MRSPLLRTALRILVLSGTIAPALTAQHIVINEFMASNSATVTDPDYHDYADWIELYNPADTAVDLKGYSLTDNLSQPTEYPVTSDLIVPAHGFLLIWADSRSTGPHTNFKLSASGESIGLFDPSGAVVDTLSFGPQDANVSSGRVPNGSAAWYRLSPASPGAPNTEAEIADRLSAPILSSPSGFYTSPLFVALSHPIAGISLRYTLDGHTPTTTSPAYAVPIRMDSTTVLRVKAFKTGSLPSAVITATYLLNELTTLPVFSLVTDPENFFSDTSGIYVIGTNGITAHCSTAPRNWNQDWERPVDLELFEANRASAFKSPCGVQIFGGCARLYPEKSLSFYFRDTYGAGSLSYRLFPDLTITQYNNFILRSSGQDWWRTMFRDGMAQTLIRQGTRVDCQDYRPSILFLNGQYWGIHNIREKLNEHYINEHYGVSTDSIDLVEISKGIGPVVGDLLAYNSLVSLLSTRDLSVQAHYDSVASLIDVDNYIDYNIAEIYGANGDWPGANMRLWRERKASGRWRWMVSDLDFTFGGNAQGQWNTNTLAQATATNGPSWPNPPWSTLMLRSLLANAGFRNEFIQRFAVHLTTTFEPGHINAVIDSLRMGIASEIPRHKIRWPQSISFTATWNDGIQIMRDFATARPAAMLAFIASQFSLTGTCSLVVSRSDPAQGKVYAHGIEIRTNGSTTVVFRNIPLKVKAVSMPGYRFVGWQGASTSTAPEVTLIVNSNSTLTAMFEPASLAVTTPVINEINYKSSSLFDTDDWVEFYNPSSSTADLGGWTFRGEGATVYTFPSGTTMGGRAYLVLCRDTARFRSLRPEVKLVIGNTGFGMSSSGEHIQLRDSSGTVVDEVTYAPGGTWPSAANGTGATLALINPQFDHSLPQNWRASQDYGTPGALNDVYTRIIGTDAAVPGGFILYQNYPNPFNPATTVRFGLPVRAVVSLNVYNALGQLVSELIGGELEAGYHEAVFRAQHISSGVYFVRLTARPSGNGGTDGFVQSRKLLLVQ